MVEVLHGPRVAVLKTAGINCDAETQYAFEKGGAGQADIVHVNQLASREVQLGAYRILVIPGGFSYGDDLASGRVLALELQTRLADQLQEHVRQGRVVIGICNGFQVLAQTGLLPFGRLSSLDQATISLAPNVSGRFESRWVHLSPQQSQCQFIPPGEPIALPVAHGEGRFVAADSTLQEIKNQGLVVFRYCDALGQPTQDYPANPNGAMHAIAGICDPSGNILGLMPHPERIVDRSQHPNWRRLPSDFTPGGLKIIQSIVDYAREM